MKFFGLIPLTEEISKQSRIDSVNWILVLTPMNIYSEMEQAEQDKLQKINIEGKRNTR